MTTTTTTPAALTWHKHPERPTARVDSSGRFLIESFIPGARTVHYRLLDAGSPVGEYRTQAAAKAAAEHRA